MNDPKLAEVLKAEDDEIRPRKDWRSSFHQVFGTPAKAPVLMSYDEYLLCCDSLGTKPMTKSAWNLATGQT